MLDQRMLMLLIVFKDCNTLTDAASRLFISQPAATKTAKALEDQMGVRLFDRSKKTVTLNDTGRYAATLADKLLILGEDMIRQIRDYDSTHSKFYCGSVSPGPLYLLKSQLKALINPENLMIDVHPEEKLINDLKNNRYQMLVLSRQIDDPDLFSCFYTEESLKVSVPHSNPLSCRPTAAFSEINGLPFLIHDRVGEWNNIIRTCLPDSDLLHNDDFESTARILNKTNLCTFTSNICDLFFPSQKMRSTISITDPEATKQYYLTVRADYKEDFLSPIADFVNKIAESSSNTF